MRCLNEVELQALADGEGDQAAAAHLEACAACRARVETIRRDLREIGEAIGSAGQMSARLEARVRESLASGQPVRGSTTLRGPLPAPVWRRPRLVLGLATAAVVALVVWGVLPRFGAPTTLSASQVLGRSLETLSKRQGVEISEYELVTQGLTNGTWGISLMVDHERPTRYLVATFSPDGELQAAFSQDPLRQRRAHLTRVDGRNYIVRVPSVPAPLLSLPQMAQALVETVITMMQATSDQKLTLIDGPNGRQYVVEMPAVTPAQSAATLDLHYARMTVDAHDFRIREFQASGALLKQPFSVSFKLLAHMTSTNVTYHRPDTGAAILAPFDIQAGPDDVVLEGTASDHPMDEILTTLIRELARARTF